MEICLIRLKSWVPNHYIENSRRRSYEGALELASEINSENPKSSIDIRNQGDVKAASKASEAKRKTKAAILPGETCLQHSSSLETKYLQILGAFTQVQCGVSDCAQNPVMRYFT